MVATVLALGIVIAALSIASARLGPTIDAVKTASWLDGTLVNTQVMVTFAQPMRLTTVEKSFTVRPPVNGDFSWSGNELLFIPRHNLAYGTTYTLRIGTGAQDSSGRHLAHAFQTSFTTQSQHLLYVGTQGSERDHLVLASVTGRRSIVGPQDGLISDFSVSSDGTLVTFVKKGSVDERANEIWLLSLADDSSQRVFRHADWDISQPHFSPDGRYIVFLATNVRLCRPYYGCYRDTRPEIYLLDLRSRKTFPFHSQTDVPLTNFVSFSPHEQVAYTDLGSALTLANPDGSNVFHIPNAGNSLEFQGFDPPGDKAAFVGQTPESTGGDILVYAGSRYVDVSRGVYDSSTPAFATSGNRIAYAAYRGELGIEPIYGLNVYDFKRHQIQKLTAERRLSDWQPQWSLDDRYIAFVRSEPQEAMYMGAGEIWVIGSNGRGARPLGAIGRDVQWVL